MNSENLAQIGEGYIQAQQAQQAQGEPEEKSSAAKVSTGDKEGGDEFDVKVLGDLVCEVMDIIFSRISWERLSAEEKQLVSGSFVSVIKKRVPKVVGWGSEVSFGIVMAMIILTRISIPGEVEEYREEKNKNGNKGVADSSNLGSPGRGKNLFPRKSVKKVE